MSAMSRGIALNTPKGGSRRGFDGSAAWLATAPPFADTSGLEIYVAVPRGNPCSLELRSLELRARPTLPGLGGAGFPAAPQLLRLSTAPTPKTADLEGRANSGGGAEAAPPPHPKLGKQLSAVDGPGGGGMPPMPGAPGSGASVVWARGEVLKMGQPLPSVGGNCDMYVAKVPLPSATKAAGWAGAAGEVPTGVLSLSFNIHALGGVGEAKGADVAELGQRSFSVTVNAGIDASKTVYAYLGSAQRDAAADLYAQ